MAEADGYIEFSEEIAEKIAAEDPATNDLTTTPEEFNQVPPPAVTGVLHPGYYSTDLCCIDDLGECRNINTVEPWGTVPVDLLPSNSLRYGFSFTNIPHHINPIEYYKKRDPPDGDIEFKQYTCSEIYWALHLSDISISRSIINRENFLAAHGLDGPAIIQIRTNKTSLNGIFGTFINHDYTDVTSKIAWDDYQARKPHIETLTGYNVETGESTWVVDMSTLSWDIDEGAEKSYGAPAWGFRQNTKEVFMHDPEDQRTDLTEMLPPIILPSYHSQRNQRTCHALGIAKSGASIDLKKEDSWIPSKFVIQVIRRRIKWDDPIYDPRCPEDRQWHWDMDQTDENLGASTIMHFAFAPDDIYGLEELKNAIIDFPMTPKDPFLGYEINNESEWNDFIYYQDPCPCPGDDCDDCSDQTPDSYWLELQNVRDCITQNIVAFPRRCLVQDANGEGDCTWYDKYTDAGWQYISEIFVLGTTMVVYVSRTNDNGATYESIFYAEIFMAPTGNRCCIRRNVPNQDNLINCGDDVGGNTTVTFYGGRADIDPCCIDEGTSSSSSEESGKSSSSSSEESGKSSSSSSEESGKSSSSEESGKSSSSSSEEAARSSSSSSSSSGWESSSSSGWESSSSSEFVLCPVEEHVLEIFVYFELRDGTRLLLFRGKAPWPIRTFPFTGAITFENELEEAGAGLPYEWENDDLAYLLNEFWAYKMFLNASDNFWQVGYGGTITASPGIINPKKLCEEKLNNSLANSTNRDYAGYFDTDNPAFAFLNNTSNYNATSIVNSIDKTYKETDKDNKPTTVFTPYLLSHNTYTYHVFDRRIFEGDILGGDVVEGLVVDAQNGLVRLPGLVAITPDSINEDDFNILTDDCKRVTNEFNSIYLDGVLDKYGGDREIEATEPGKRDPMMKMPFVGVHPFIGQQSMYDLRHLNLVTDAENAAVGYEGEDGLSRNGRDDEATSPFWYEYDLSSDIYKFDGVIEGGKSVVKVQISGEFAINRYLRQIVQTHTSVSNDMFRLYKYYNWDGTPGEDDPLSFETYDKYNCIIPKTKVEAINFVLRCFEKETSRPGLINMWRMSELMTSASMIHRKMLQQFPDDDKFIFNYSGGTRTSFPFCYAADSRGIILLRLRQNGLFSSEILVRKDDIGGDDVSSENYIEVQKWFDNYLAATGLTNIVLDGVLNAIESDFTEKFTSGMLFDVSEETCNKMSDHCKLPYIRSFALALRRLNETNRIKEVLCEAKFTIGCRPLDLFRRYEISEEEQSQINEIDSMLGVANNALSELKSAPEADRDEEAIADMEIWILFLEESKQNLEEDEYRDLSEVWFIPSGCSPLNTSIHSNNLAHQFRSYESYNCGYFREISTVGIHNDTNDVYEDMQNTDHWGQMFTEKIWDSNTITEIMTAYSFYGDKNTETVHPWLPPGFYRIKYETEEVQWNVYKNYSRIRPGYPRNVNSAMIWAGGGGEYSIHPPDHICNGVMFSYTFAPPCSNITYTSRVPGWPRLTPGDVRQDGDECRRLTFPIPAILQVAVIGHGRYKYMAHFGGIISIGTVDGTPDELTYRLDPITVYSTFIDQTIINTRSVIKLDTITTGISLPQISGTTRFYVESFAVERGGGCGGLGIDDFAFGNRAMEECMNIFTARPLEWMGVQTNVFQGENLIKCPDDDPPILVEGRYYCPKGNLSIGGRPHRISSTLTGPEFCNGAISYHDIVDEARESWDIYGVTFEQVQLILEELQDNDAWLADLHTIFDNRGIDISQADNYILPAIYAGNMVRFRDFNNTTITTTAVQTRKELDRATCLGFDKSTWKYGEDGWWDLPSSSSSSSETSSSSSEEIGVCPPRADHIQGTCCVERFAYKRGRIVSVEEGVLYLSTHGIKDVDVSFDPMNIPLSFHIKNGRRTKFLEAYLPLASVWGDLAVEIGDIPSYVSSADFIWGFIKYIDLTYDACKNVDVREIAIATLGESLNVVDKIQVLTRSQLPVCNEAVVVEAEGEDNEDDDDIFFDDDDEIIAGAAAEDLVNKKAVAENTRKNIDIRFSQAGKIGIFGKNVANFPIKSATAVGFSYDDFHDFKINGPYSSMVYDARGVMYVFYEESESSSSSSEECVAIDLTKDGSLEGDTINQFILDQVKIDSEREGNISVAVSYDRGNTWFDFRGLIRLKVDESASKPYAVSDFKTNTIHLYFVFDHYYLAVQDIDCTLFDLHDAYSDYTPLAQWDTNTVDNAGLEQFNQKGMIMRQRYFTIIDGGPDIIINIADEKYWRDPCADNRIRDDSKKEFVKAIEKYEELKDENDRINPARTKRRPKQAKVDTSQTNFTIRMRFGRELEFEKIYQDFKETGGELTPEICSSIDKIRAYSRTLFACIKDNKGVQSVWTIDKYRGMGAILNTHNGLHWNIVMDNVCFHASNPYEDLLDTLDDDSITEYYNYYTFICNTYNLNTFRSVPACYGSDIKSDEYVVNEEGSQPTRCKTLEERIEKLKEDIARIKALIEAIGIPSGEADRQLLVSLKADLIEKERELSALEEITTEELGIGVDSVNLFEAAAKLKQIQLSYDVVRDKIGFIFIYDHGLYVRKFDNSVVQLISTNAITNLTLAMKMFNLSSDSPNKAIFLSGSLTDTDLDLYVVPDGASDITVSHDVQPAGYFDSKGYLKVFYNDCDHSIWTITLNSPEFTPYIT